VGLIRLADLKRRPSRRYALEALLATFALNESADRGALQTLLGAASARLGQLEPDDTFADPRFMARYALNRIDPKNWPPVEGGQAYVSPPEEARHLEALQREHAPQMIEYGIDAAIQNALEDSARSGPELAVQAVAYAQQLSTLAEMPEDVLGSRANAIVSAAMVLARDGADGLLDQHEGWARNVFAQAFASTDDIAVSRMRDGIRFNPVGISALGIIHLWRRRGLEADRDALLELAGRDDPHAAQGFGAGLVVIRAVDPLLVPALLRCALTAQIHPAHDWNEPEQTKAARQAKRRERVALAVRAEVTWLNRGGPEPAWPTPLPRMISVQRRRRIGGDDGPAQPAEAARPTDQFRSQSAALWLRQLTRGSDAVDLAWIVSFVDTYADWTAAANGAGLEPGTEIDVRTGEWNSTFFSLLARAFACMKPDEAAAHVARAVAVPDESFFDIASEFVPAIDRAYFNRLGSDLNTTLRLRTLLADRLIQTVGWRRERDRSELSVEMRIGPAIAALFFSHYSSFTGTSNYLLAEGIDQVAPFLPELARLIDEGPVPFTGLLTMNLLEVSPRPAHTGFLLSSALVWLRRQPTNTPLWVDGGLGARVARWLGVIFKADAALCSRSHPLRYQMDDVLARLVQVGVAEAHRVEALIATTIDPKG
jgi:hypothetical protein